MANISLANLYVLFKARGLTRLKTRINILKGDLMGVSNQLDGMEHKAKIAFMGTAAAIGFGIYQAAKFQHQMQMVNTMLTSGQQNYLPGYAGAVKDLSIQYGESTETISKGLYDILSSAVPADKALYVLNQSMIAATGGFTSTEVAADALTTVLNSFQMSADTSGAIVDKMFQTVKDGKVTFEEYAHNIGKLTATADLAGLSMEEMNAAVSTVSRGGIDANRAMAHLVGFVRAFIKPTKEAKETAASYGIQLSDVHLRTTGLIGVIKEMSNLPTDALTKVFGDVRGFKAAAALINDQQGLMNDLSNQYNAYGAASEAANKATQSMMMSFKQIWESLIKIMNEGGQIFTPLVTGLAELVKALSNTPPVVKEILFGFLSLKAAMTGLQIVTMMAAKASAARTLLLGKDTLQTNLNTASIAKNTAALAANGVAASTSGIRNIFPRARSMEMPEGFLKNQGSAIQKPSIVQMMWDQVRQDQYKVRAIPIPKMRIGEITKATSALKETVSIMGKGAKGTALFIGNLTGLSDVFSLVGKSIVALATPVTAFIGSIVAIGAGIALITDRLLGGAWAWDTWGKKVRDENNVKIWNDISKNIQADLEEVRRNIAEIDKQLEQPIDTKKRAALLAERGKEEEKELRIQAARNQKILEDAQRRQAEAKAKGDDIALPQINREIEAATRNVDIFNKKLADKAADNRLLNLNVTLEDNKEAFKAATKALSEYAQESWSGSKKIEESIDLLNKKYSGSSSMRGVASRVEMEQDINDKIEKDKKDLADKIAKIREQEATEVKTIITQSGATIQQIEAKRLSDYNEHLTRKTAIEKNITNLTKDEYYNALELENAFYNTVVKNREGLTGAYAEAAYAAHSAAKTAIKDAERLIDLEGKRALLIKQRQAEEMGQFNDKRRQTEQSNAIELEKYEVEQNITDEYRKRVRLAQIERREAQRQIWNSFGENANKFGELFRGDLLKGTQSDLFKNDLDYLKRMREIAKDISSNISNIFSNISGKFGDVIDKIQEIINPQMNQQNVYNKMREDLYGIVDKYSEATKNIADKSKLIPKSYYKDMYSEGTDVIQEGSRTLYRSRKEYKSLAQYYKDIFANGTNVLEKLEKAQKGRDLAGKFVELTDVWRNLQSSAAKPTISLSMGEQQQLNEMIELRTFLENQIKNGITVQLKV